MASREHTCIADIYPHDAKCLACEEDKAEYEAECAKAEAEQAQEEQDRFDYGIEQEPH